MVHPLAHVYLTHRCNVCGHTYRISLYEVLEEKRVNRDWRSPRPEAATHSDFDSLMSVIPLPPLEAIDAAWQRFLAELPSSIELHS